MSKRKLLLADDSVTIQKVVNLTFADEGIEVISVGDGNSAMDKIREESPDLIMADVNMPGLNGYEICEKVREIDGYSQTPVILLVGSFEPFDESEAERVGADSHLTKPFQSINQLVNTVNALLNPVFEEETTLEEEIAMPAYAGFDEGVANATTESNFDDAEIDDEMIQADQIGSQPTRDLSEFQVPEITTTFPDQSEEHRVEPESSLESSETPDGSGDEDMTEFSFAEPGNNDDVEVDSSITEDEVSSGFDSNPSEESTSDESESDAENYQERYEDEDIQSRNSQSEVKLDEGNLLELPRKKGQAVAADGSLDELTHAESADVVGENGESEELEKLDENPDALNYSDDDSYSEQDFETLNADSETEIETEALETSNVRSESDTLGSLSQADIDEITRRVSDNFAEKPVTAPDSVSPEIVEEITKRVMESLSEKAVKEIAWEVVPRTADRIVREIAEEQMKE